MKNLIYYKINILCICVFVLFLLFSSCRGKSSSENNGNYNFSENTDNYDSESDGYIDENEHGNKESSLPTFQTEYDVISFLNSRTFEDEGGNTLRIKTNSIYYNGQPITTTPRVKEFNGCEAIIVSKDPTGSVSQTLWLVENSGELFIEDANSGELYYMK